ncbi:PVC-type heme-binding CxxCH protein [Fimbriiglobus ruber]|uniref:Cytochrome c domain-containing protein n=1 Tax=Fimbriiglobus ruber TaxID=1908690 RepID=A0A225E1Q9_9BACT|nr:PVC-type heme-binding CxxCH protein [Fimbriiglobus ruber]OWK43976.1 hypothetical protein FRUB_03575 [Fimbriiglobus ruber]
MSELRTVLVLLLTACAAVAKPPGALPTHQPDWKVEVVAEAPKLLHPSVVCCAPDGRVFVAEDPMDMGNDSEKPTDRILCFHPGGKVTVFAEKLHAVFGLAYVDGKVYVHHCPKFSVFTDDDGVGKDRKDLIATTNPRPNTGFNDHIPSNIRLGMDGWLYMSTGDKGIYGAVGTDGSKAQIYGGGVLRFRPDGSHLEVYSSGTRNHLDVAVTAEDEIFTYDNTDDGNGWWTRVTHMVDGGFYGYPWDYKPQRPYTLWMMTDYGGGSPTGAIAYNEDALPAKYRGNLFFCEWGRKQFLRLTVERNGGTYKIANREDFLTGGPSEFRPVGVAVSPDGMSLYVTDWNYGGWKQNVQVGRLLKVTYTGKSEAAPKPEWFVPAAMGKKFEAKTAELVAGLKHPAQSVRLVAQRRLADRGQEAIEPVTALLNDAKAPAFARWSAIWTLDAIDGGKSSRTAIIAALKDDDASVRRQAARQLGTRAAREATSELTKLLVGEDASVRFQAAAALGRIGDKAAVPALQSALGQSDLFSRYAAFTALNRIGRADPSAWPAIVAGLASEASAIREGSQFALRETYVEGLAVALAAFAADAKHPAEARAAAVAALAALHRKPLPWNGQWWGTQPVRSPRPAGVDAWAGTPVALKAVRDSLKSDDAILRRAAIEAVAVVKDADSAAALVPAFPKESDPEVKRAILRALAAVKSPAAADLVASLLAKPGETPDLLADAVAAAGQIGGAKMTEALTSFIASQAPPVAVASAIEFLGTQKATAAVPTIAARLTHADAKVRTAAVAALAAIGGEPAAKALVSMLADKKPDVRRAAIGALAVVKSKSAIEPLLKAFADPDTRFEAVAALAATPDIRAFDAYLEGLGSKNATVRDECRKAVTAIRVAALPKIDTRLDQTPPLSQAVVGELQRVYSTAAPIRSWRVLGAFTREAKPPFDPTTPTLDAEYKDANGKPVRWKATRTDAGGKVNLLRQGFSLTGDASAYAYAEIDSKTARAVEMIAGSDDGLTVWVNGKQVFEVKGDRGYNADAFHIKANLTAGRNVILAKITQGGGPWEFSIAVPEAGTGRLFETTAHKLDPAEFATFATKTTGNPAHGKVLYADLKGLACIKCHVAGPPGSPGGDVGPSLAGIGVKYNRLQLIESVLYPSKQILDGYQQTRVATLDGRVIVGVVRGETPDDVTILDAEARKIVIKKADIEERKVLDKSVMPEGLQAGLTPQDFADLIAFLESLKEKPPEKK